MIEVKNMEIVTITEMELPKRHILYLHGGGYKYPLADFHLEFGKKLIEGTETAIHFPEFPLVPNSTYDEAYDKVLELYIKLHALVDAENITIMGDSSGGGLALGLSQLLLEKGVAQPKNIILISPWLDITLKNPDIKNYEKLDEILDRHWLKDMGIKWAGNQDLDYFMLSPINGKLKDLGKLIVIVGSKELFLPDSRLLVSKLKGNNVDFEYYEYEDMVHTFPLFCSAKTDEAIKIIKAKIK